MPQDDAALALSNLSPPGDPAGDQLVSRDEFLRTIGAPGHRAAVVLRALLGRCNPGAPLPEQLTAIEQLGRYLVAGPGVPTASHPALVRLEWLVVALEQLPAVRGRFQATLGAVLEATRGVRLFGEVGLPNNRGLFAETTDRLARRLLPEPPATHELWRLAGHMVRRLDDLSWLGPAADDLLRRLAIAGGDAWKPLRSGMLDAIGLLTTRIAALGMSEALHSRTPTESLRSSPLYRLTRAAAVGNVAAVAAGAIAFDLVWQRTTGAPYLDPATARATVASLDLLGWGVVPWAPLTGVMLWLSSLAAGWFENWIVYRQLPEAIEHHRLGKRIGRARMARLARFLEREAAGFGGSIALGFLLGMVPVSARFFGLPVEVPHVTLSTGAFALALSSLGVGAAGASWSALIDGVLGIAVIGLCNFGVSFTLALIVALRARDVPRGEAKTLPGAVLRRFARRPLEFFYPPRDAGPPEATAH